LSERVFPNAQKSSGASRRSRSVSAAVFRNTIPPTCRRCPVSVVRLPADTPGHRTMPHFRAREGAARNAARGFVPVAREKILHVPWAPRGGFIAPPPFDKRCSLGNRDHRLRRLRVHAPTGTSNVSETRPDDLLESRSRRRLRRRRFASSWRRRGPGADRPVAAAGALREGRWRVEEPRRCSTRTAPASTPQTTFGQDRSARPARPRRIALSSPDAVTQPRLQDETWRAHRRLAQMRLVDKFLVPSSLRLLRQPRSEPFVEQRGRRTPTCCACDHGRDRFLTRQNVGGLRLHLGQGLLRSIDSQRLEQRRHPTPLGKFAGLLSMPSFGLQDSNHLAIALSPPSPSVPICPSSTKKAFGNREGRIEWSV